MNDLQKLYATKHKPHSAHPVFVKQVWNTDVWKFKKQYETENLTVKNKKK